MISKRFFLLIPILSIILFLGMQTAWAQNVTIGFGNNTGVTQRAIQLIALITILSLAPSILIMVTSFTRIVVVLSLLRTAIGVQQSPPNVVIVSLSLFLTAFIMMPVLQEAYNTGVTPLVENKIDLTEAVQKSSEPFKLFMLKHVREKDLRLFFNLAKAKPPEKPEDVEMRILIPSFIISELRRAFEIGFLLFVPFIIIDLVVASVLMSMGMMMLPPIMISLPFKLIFFVLVDGWHLVSGSLVQSFGQ